MEENPHSFLYEVEEHQDLMVVEFTTLPVQDSMSGARGVGRPWHVTLPGRDSRGAIQTLHLLYSKTS